MTVLELINELEKYDGGLKVVVNGYGGGLLDVGSANPIKVDLTAIGEWYYGQYELAGEHNNGKKFVVYISPYPWGKGAGGGSY